MGLYKLFPNVIVILLDVLNQMSLKAPIIGILHYALNKYAIWDYWMPLKFVSIVFLFALLSKNFIHYIKTLIKVKKVHRDSQSSYNSKKIFNNYQKDY